jgi:hypothetical protein
VSLALAVAIAVFYVWPRTRYVNAATETALGSGYSDLTPSQGWGGAPLKKVDEVPEASVNLAREKARAV